MCVIVSVSEEIEPTIEIQYQATYEHSHFGILVGHYFDTACEAVEDDDYAYKSLYWEINEEGVGGWRGRPPCGWGCRINKCIFVKVNKVILKTYKES